MKPLFSVIIPTYNEEKMIGGLLQELAKVREKQKIEIIVSDGKSTNNTVQIAKRYNAKIIVAQSNIASAKNYGASVARGKLLVFLDADVRFKNVDSFFSTVKKVFEEKIGGATTNIFVYPEQSTLVDKIFHLTYNKLLRFLIWLGIGSCRGECQIIRKNVFKKLNGFNINLVASEDAELFYRLSGAFKIKFIKNLCVFESPRRYRKLGYIRTLLYWFLNGISIFLFKKSYSKVWEKVR